MTIIVNPYDVTYDAAAHTSPGMAIGVAGADLSAGLRLGATSHAGTYIGDVWTFDGGNNYYDVSGTVDNVINKANAVVTVNGYSGTYDAAAHGATGSVVGVSGDAAAIGSSLDLGDSFTNAPGGTATWTFSGGTNYNDQSGAADIVISKANAIVTVNGYVGTYDAASHGPTGLVVGVTGDLLAIGSVLDLGASFTNAPGGTASWTFSGGTNYNDQSGTADIVIAKASSSVTATGGSFTYDGTTHTGGSATVSGAGVVTGSPVLSYSGDQINAGAYTVIATYAGDENHTGSSDTALINIDKADQTISWSNPAAITYGAALSGTQLNASVAGVVGGTAPGGLVYSPPIGTVLNAGDHQTLIVNAAATSNYNAATATVYIDVAKAGLTVTVNDLTRVYSAATPGFSGAYSGFVNGDDAGDLNGTLAFTPADTSTLLPSDYAVTPGGLTSSNYSVTYVAGTLTVVPVGIVNGQLVFVGTDGRDIIHVELDKVKNGSDPTFSVCAKLNVPDSNKKGGSNGGSDNGSDGNNVIVAGNGSNRIETGSGHDQITTGNGNNDIRSGGGNDVITTGSGSDRIDAGDGNDLVRAGAGNDTIEGGDGDDVLIGGDGNDLIEGGKGRDLMIGGIGADRIIGNQDKDILVAGWAAYDNNDAAIAALMLEWTSGNNNATRRSNITNGTGLTAGFRLIGDHGAAQTVFNDNDVDILTGSQGIDWFFANRYADHGGVLDIITDKSSSEQWNDTDF